MIKNTQSSGQYLIVYPSVWGTEVNDKDKDSPEGGEELEEETEEEEDHEEDGVNVE